VKAWTTGNLAGIGTFRCTSCEYALTLDGADELPACPNCGGNEFVRASLFSTVAAAMGEVQPAAEDAQWRDELRDHLDPPGEYLAYLDGEDKATAFVLQREWTRIGRSLAADIRFDDPTVSRRHALIVRQPDGLRVLDDRSLNGVFVNGARIDGRALQDGDEIIVGRYRLSFVRITADAAVEADPGSGPVGSVG
jgi:hypothetical protein